MYLNQVALTDIVLIFSDAFFLALFITGKEHIFFNFRQYCTGFTSELPPSPVGQN
jgi:hypothetical protein